MKAFAPYTKYLESIACEVLSRGPEAIPQDELHSLLNGDAASQLRELVPLSIRRRHGAFFTGSDLRRRAIIPGGHDTSFVDPACGAGDLLIECTHHLPAQSSFEDTLSDWSARIHGRDIHPEFVRATRARLVLAAAARLPSFSGRARMPRLSNLFQQVRAGNGLTYLKLAQHPTRIVMNPPFNPIRAPKTCDWATGKISSAALFVARALEHAAPGTRVSAILPDALRSGPRYRAWRQHIESFGTIESTMPLGIFDKWTDIDVFHLEVTAIGPERDHRQRSEAQWTESSDVTRETVSEYFEISVGAVVPFRDPEEGHKHPYITARMLPRWDFFWASTDTRRFIGRLNQPPFIAVRRTSRPEDVPRLVGTLVLGDEPVAVENHLIVFTPRDGSASRCAELLDLLNSPATTAWVNQRSGCRHVSARILRQLPWRPNDQ